jgi:hypothetical protein
VNDLPPSPPPASASPSRWPWLLGVIPVGVGAFLGYQAAYLSSTGGFGGGMAAAFVAYAIVGLVLILLLVGAANVLRPAGRGRAASQFAFAGAGLLVAGAAGGAAAVAIFDLEYRPPVVLGARGEATITLEGVQGFEPRAAGRADCWSVADRTDVQEVVALSLGELNGSVLRADIFLPVEGNPRGSVSVFVEASRLPEGSVPPVWDTEDLDVDALADGATGSLTFDAVPLRVASEIGPPAGSWPATLSGQISWTCEAWVASDATPPPVTAGQITLDLNGVDWSSTANAAVTCEYEPDGSVANLVGDRVGLLQDEPMAVSLGLLGDPRQGDDVDLMLSVHIGAPSQGSSVPKAAVLAATSGRGITWANLATIEEIADGGRTGRLTFSDLPNEGTPDAAWPATLSGQLSWECG